MEGQEWSMTVGRQTIFPEPDATKKKRDQATRNSGHVLFPLGDTQHDLAVVVCVPAPLPAISFQPRGGIL